MHQPRNKALLARFALSPVALEAASLLRWSTLPFRELRPDWPDAVERRVALAAARLDAYDASAG